MSIGVRNEHLGGWEVVLPQVSRGKAAVKGHFLETTGLSNNYLSPSTHTFLDHSSQIAPRPREVVKVQVFISHIHDVKTVAPIVQSKGMIYKHAIQM